MSCLKYADVINAYVISEKHDQYINYKVFQCDSLMLEHIRPLVLTHKDKWTNFGIVSFSDMTYTLMTSVYFT
jgi:hypothetical protein